PPRLDGQQPGSQPGCDRRPSRRGPRLPRDRGVDCSVLWSFGYRPRHFRAPVKIGASGQASIDVVAGPVGEALIMTALGLVVAVPAVLAYNWLVRRNKSIMEDLAAFTNDLHGYLMSNGAVKPNVGGPATKGTAQARTGAAPTTPGTDPLRRTPTPTGAKEDKGGSGPTRPAS